MTARMPEGVPQPDGTRRPEPVMDVDDAARAVRYMASLPPGLQRSVHDRDGRRHALRRPRLIDRHARLTTRARRYDRFGSVGF